MLSARSSRAEEWLSFAQMRARRAVDDAQAAEDISQDAMFRLFDQATAPDNIEAWLTTIIRNLAADHHRGEQRRAGAGDVEAGGLPDEHDLLHRGRLGEATSYPVIQRMRIEQSLAHLSDRMRAVLEAHLEGSSNQEIADQFGYAGKAAVAATISRAKKQIREADEPWSEARRPIRRDEWLRLSRADNEA